MQAELDEALLSSDAEDGHVLTGDETKADGQTLSAEAMEAQLRVKIEQELRVEVRLRLPCVRSPYRPVCAVLQAPLPANTPVI